jgi:hypothetical protein
MDILMNMLSAFIPLFAAVEILGILYVLGLYRINPKHKASFTWKMIFRCIFWPITIAWLAYKEEKKIKKQT